MADLEGITVNLYVPWLRLIHVGQPPFEFTVEQAKAIIRLRDVRVGETRLKSVKRNRYVCHIVSFNSLNIQY